MQTERPFWTVLARLLRPQGRRGEVLAELMTDFPESLAGRGNLFLVPGGFSGGTEDARPVVVSDSWLPTGKNRGRVVLQLDGIESISAAELVSGLDLAVPEQSRVPLEDGSTYVSDLVGSAVYDKDILIGEIEGVEFPASSEGVRLEDAPSLLQVRAIDGAEVLIPFVKAFFVALDPDSRKVVLDLPAGLVDVNR